MEYILGIGLLALIGSKFINNMISSIVFIGIIVISIIITFIYKLPYIISLGVCILVKQGLTDFLVNLKSLSKTIIKSKRRYYNGYLQKLVNILINCDYLIFTLICYGFLVNELINNNLTTSSNEAIVASIIVIISLKLFRKVLDKIVNAY